MKQEMYFYYNEGNFVYFIFIGIVFMIYIIQNLFVLIKGY